jgi:hypothetical protein
MRKENTVTCLKVTSQNSQEMTKNFGWSSCTPTVNREGFLVMEHVRETKLRGLSPQANYTDRLSDRRLSAKLVPTLADRGCRVVSATESPTVVNFRISRPKNMM